MNEVKKRLIFLVLTSISIVMACFFTYNYNIEKVNIVSDDFVIKLLGALLALSITIITLVYTLIKKIHERIADHPNKNNIKKTTNSLFSTLKKDVWAVFVFLITVVLLRNADVYLTLKTNALTFVKITVLFSSFFAVADIILCFLVLLVLIRKA
jgi:hypothetical protein